jgi:hypothetical protein
MTDYVPLRNQNRRRVLMRCGYVAIALTYLGAAASLWFTNFFVQIAAIGAGVLLPPVIERLLPSSIDGIHRRDGDLLAGLLTISTAILIVSFFFLAPSTLKHAMVILLGGVAVTVGVLVVGRWIVHAPDGGPKRLILTLLVVGAGGLMTGAVVGEAFVRWTCIGILSAFLLTIVQRPEGNTAAHEDEAIEDANFRYEDKQSHVDLRFLDHILDEAHEALRYSMHGFAGGQQRWEDERRHRAIAIAVATLANMRMLSPKLARRMILSLSDLDARHHDDATTSWLRSRLAAELVYARAQIDAHARGLDAPALNRALGLPA